MRRWIWISFALAFILVLASQGVAQAATIDVGVEDFEFDPERVAIRPGDTVRWTNRDDAHTSTSDDQDNQTPLGPPGVGWWDSGLLSEDQSFSWDFTAAGTFSDWVHTTSEMGQVVTAPTPGTYSFRARLTRDGVGLILGTSLYSPPRSITVA